MTILEQASIGITRRAFIAGAAALISLLQRNQPQEIVYHENLTDLTYADVDQPYRHYVYVYLDGELCMSRSPDGNLLVNGKGVQAANAAEGWISYYDEKDRLPIGMPPSNGVPIRTAHGRVQILFIPGMREEWMQQYGHTHYRKYLA